MQDKKSLHTKEPRINVPKFVDEAFKKIYKRIKTKEIRGMNTGYSSSGFNEDKDGGGHASFKKSGKWYKVADYIKARLGVLVYDNYVLEGYATGRNVDRSIIIRATGTGVATTCTFEGLNPYTFNQDALASETVTEGSGGTRFSTDATGGDLTILGIDNVIGIKSASIIYTNQGTNYNIFLYYSGGNLIISHYDPSGVKGVWSDLANAKRIDFIINYVTSS